MLLSHQSQLISPLGKGRCEKATSASSKQRLQHRHGGNMTHPGCRDRGRLHFVSGVATFRVRTKDISLVRQFTLLFVLVLFFRVFAICFLNLSFMPFFFLSFLFLYFFLFLFFLLSFHFSLFQCVWVCWRPYVVLVVFSTMAWHCIVYSPHSHYSTMRYLCVDFLPRMKHQHGHWVCWMSADRKKGFLAQPDRAENCGVQALARLLAVYQ